MIDRPHSIEAADLETSRRVRTLRLLVILVLIAAAGALLALSFVSYETLKSHVNAYAVDRSADISRTAYDRLVLALRLLTAGLVGLAAAVVVGRERVDRGLSVLGPSVHRGVRQIAAEIASVARAETIAHRVAFATVCALGLALRLEYMGLPMRYDEATSYDNYASRPLYIGLTDYREPNNHLFHTFLVHLSTGIFGTAPWAVRLPALIAGVLVVPATYALVRILSGGGPALLTAGLVATSSILIDYSTNARGYTIVALLFLLLLIVGARVVATNSGLAWTTLTILATLALYTMPPAIYAVGGAGLWIALSGARRRGVVSGAFLRRLGASALTTALLTALLYAPVAAVSGVGSITSNQFVSPKTFHAFASGLPGHLHTTWDAWNRDLPAPVQGLLAAAFVLGVLLTPRLSPFKLHPAPVVAFCAALIVLAQRVIPYPRVWLFLLPVYLGTVAMSLAFVVRRLTEWMGRAGSKLTAGALVTAVAGLCTLVLSSSSIRDSRETGALLDAPRVARFLAGYVRPGDTVVATGSDSILEYYLRRDGVDPAPLLYSSRTGWRVIVVVNLLGDQTLDQVLPRSDVGSGWSSPKPVARYPSAALFVVARR